MEEKTLIFSFKDSCLLVEMECIPYTVGIQSSEIDSFKGSLCKYLFSFVFLGMSSFK